MGWMVQGSNPGGSKIFSFSSTQPDYLWGLLTSSTMCTRAPSVGQSGQGGVLTILPHLAPRLKMGRAKPVPLHCACINMLLDELVVFQRLCICLF